MTSEYGSSSAIPLSDTKEDEADTDLADQSPDYRLLFSFQTFKDMVLEVAKLKTKNRHLRDQVKGMRAWQDEREMQYLEVTARLDQ